MYKCFFRYKCVYIIYKYLHSISYQLPVLIPKSVLVINMYFFYMLFQHFINSSTLRSQIFDCKSVEEILEIITSWEQEHLLNEEF